MSSTAYATVALTRLKGTFVVVFGRPSASTSAGNIFSHEFTPDASWMLSVMPRPRAFRYAMAASEFGYRLPSNVKPLQSFFWCHCVGGGGGGGDVRH